MIKGNQPSLLSVISPPSSSWPRSQPSGENAYSSPWRMCPGPMLHRGQLSPHLPHPPANPQVLPTPLAPEPQQVPYFLLKYPPSFVPFHTALITGYMALSSASELPQEATGCDHLGCQCCLSLAQHRSTTSTKQKCVARK